MTKTVYRHDSLGYYLYPVEAFEDPLNKGSYLIPPDCVETKPPEPSVGYTTKWNGSNWEEVEIPKDESSDKDSSDYATFSELSEYYRMGVNSI